MACVEAMQMGLIPVVTAVGEMKNYVRDGVNGLIIDPDAMDKSVAALLAVVADRDRYAAMQRAAVATWNDVKLYADDFCQSAIELNGPRLSQVDSEG